MALFEKKQADLGALGVAGGGTGLCVLVCLGLSKNTAFLVDCISVCSSMASVLLLLFLFLSGLNLGSSTIVCEILRGAFTRDDTEVTDDLHIMSACIS